MNDMNAITRESILNQEKGNFIVIKRFSQYAEGITGCTHSMTVLTKDGVGFPTKKEARGCFKLLKASEPDGFKNKKGKPSPYGEVGCVQYTIKFVNIKELRDMLNPTSFYSVTFARI